MYTKHNSIQFCPTLTPKVTSDKKLSQCRDRVFRQKRFQFMLENGSNSFWEIVGYLKTSQFIVRHSTR